MIEMKESFIYNKLIGYSYKNILTSLHKLPVCVTFYMEENKVVFKSHIVSNYYYRDETSYVSYTYFWSLGETFLVLWYNFSFYDYISTYKRIVFQLFKLFPTGKCFLQHLTKC